MTEVSAWTEQLERGVLTWPLLVIAMVGLALALAIANGPRLFRGARSVWVSFWCPLRGEDVKVEFEVAAWDGRRLDVKQCSAFDPPTTVTCDKRCLRLRDAEAESDRHVAA